MPDNTNSDKHRYILLYWLNKTLEKSTFTISGTKTKKKLPLVMTWIVFLLNQILFSTINFFSRERQLKIRQYIFFWHLTCFCYYDTISYYLLQLNLNKNVFIKLCYWGFIKTRGLCLPIQMNILSAYRNYCNVIP